MAQGSAQNETYIGQRLLFQRMGEVEVGLSDVARGADAKRILKQAILGFILIGFGLWTAGAVSYLMLDLVGDVGGGFGSVLIALAYLLPWVWLVVVLVVPRVEVLSDWHLLLDGRAPVADGVYEVVRRSLTTDRQIPATVDYWRLDVGAPVPGVRNALRVTIGKYSAYISVFAFGRDLFLGWTLWRREVPVTIVLRWVASVFGADPGFSGLIDMEPIKAMREAVHNALRQGVDASVLNHSAPLADTFGNEVPMGAPADLRNGSPVNPPATTVGVHYPVEVYSVDGEPVGSAEPGIAYELVHDAADGGVTLRDPNGALAVLTDRTAIRW